MGRDDISTMCINIDVIIGSIVRIIERTCMITYIEPKNLGFGPPMTFVSQF